MEGIGSVVTAYMHSYGAALRGGSENRDDIGGRGRLSFGMACNVRMQLAAEKVAKDCPDKLCQDFAVSSSCRLTSI
jgi:hypothetical protein